LLRFIAVLSPFPVETEIATEPNPSKFYWKLLAFVNSFINFAPCRSSLRHSFFRMRMDPNFHTAIITGNWYFTSKVKKSPWAQCLEEKIRERGEDKRSLTELKKELEAEMLSAAAELDFEKAATLRDMIQKLQ